MRFQLQARVTSDGRPILHMEKTLGGLFDGRLDADDCEFTVKHSKSEADSHFDDHSSLSVFIDGGRNRVRLY
jgi:hypothetical protein